VGDQVGRGKKERLAVGEGAAEVEVGHGGSLQSSVDSYQFRRTEN
jgi:hypothetical protein